MLIELPQYSADYTSSKPASFSNSRKKSQRVRLLTPSELSLASVIHFASHSIALQLSYQFSHIRTSPISAARMFSKL